MSTMPQTIAVLLCGWILAGVIYVYLAWSSEEKDNRIFYKNKAQPTIIYKRIIASQYFSFALFFAAFLIAFSIGFFPYGEGVTLYVLLFIFLLFLSITLGLLLYSFWLFSLRIMISDTHLTIYTFKKHRQEIPIDQIVSVYEQKQYIPANVLYKYSTKPGATAIVYTGDCAQLQKKLVQINSIHVFGYDLFMEKMRELGKVKQDNS